MNTNLDELNKLLSAPPQSTKQVPLTEQLMFEYDQLRKETLQTDVLTLQILAGVLVLTTALMTLAFSDKIVSNELNIALFFLTEIVAFIGLRQNSDRVRSTIIIASYIKNFIEPYINVKWETRLHRFRKIKTKDMSMNMMTQQRLVYMVVIFANFSLGSYYFISSYYDILSLVIAGIGFLVTVALFVREWRQYNYTNTKGVDEYDHIWKEIRDKEEEDDKDNSTQGKVKSGGAHKKSRPS